MKSAVVTQMSGAPARVGFAKTREKPASLLYTHTVNAQSAHVVDQNLELADSLLPGEARGQARAMAQHLGRDFFPREHGAETACDAALLRLGIAKFAIVNPGAGWGAKQWPAERYAEVAVALKKASLDSIINYGPGEEDLARTVEEASEGAAHSEPLSLGELIALTRRARLFIGGDTGPMHLAAAMGVPVVGLFGPTDPARNGPYGTRAILLRSQSSQTSYSHRRQQDEGLLTITAAQVIEAALSLLEKPA